MVQACIVMVLIFIALVLPLNFTFSQHKRSVTDDVLDKALQRAAVEGGLTDAGRQAILNDLSDRGIDISGAVIAPAFYSEHVRGEIIEITISIPLNADNLRGVTAVGGTPPPDRTMLTAKGSIMSEKLP